MPHVLAQDLRDAVLQAAMSGGLTKKEAGDSNITEYFKSLIDLVSEKNYHSTIA